MPGEVRDIVILGGGSAGWLIAAVLAADHEAANPGGVRITLIESPDVRTVGVGEGTWPTMRDTLRRTGVTETVAGWRAQAPRIFPLPHPSWRNTGWLRRNPWFQDELLPELRAAVADLLREPDDTAG